MLYMNWRSTFSTANHDVLMHRVARKIQDNRVLQLIGKYLRFGVSVNGRVQKTTKGFPREVPCYRSWPTLSSRHEVIEWELIV